MAMRMDDDIGIIRVGKNVVIENHAQSELEMLRDISFEILINRIGR